MWGRDGQGMAGPSRGQGTGGGGGGCLIGGENWRGGMDGSKGTKGRRTPGDTGSLFCVGVLKVPTYIHHPLRPRTAMLPPDSATSCQSTCGRIRWAIWTDGICNQNMEDGDKHASVGKQKKKVRNQGTFQASRTRMRSEQRGMTPSLANRGSGRPLSTVLTRCTVVRLDAWMLGVVPY